MILLLMGVAGSGKTTIGEKLADELGWEFFDADAFHPAANVDKMRRGLPLTDADRAPWLRALRAQIDACETAGENAIFACSALKAAYRRVLVTDPAREKLVYLHGSPELLSRRLRARRGHFMKSAMLASQLADLEEPAGALVVDIAAEPGEICARIRRAFSL